jgi:hypothetical protein
MDRDDQKTVRDEVIDAFEAVLSAQLAAVRRLKKGSDDRTRAAGERRSQMDIVEDILRQAARPLHVNAIIERARKRFQIDMDRESLVSALTKRVHRQDRFERVAPNTFSLRSEEGRS